MARAPRNKPHIHLEGVGLSEAYTSPRIVISGLPPARARAAHAQRLKKALDTVVSQARSIMSARDESIAASEPGFYLEFKIPVAEASAVEALENKPKNIELVAVKPPAEGELMLSATVFVPDRSADFFGKKIEAYRTEDTPKGRPKNEALVARIEGVALGVVRSLFTDDDRIYPRADHQVWWEIWIRDGRLAEFHLVASRFEIRTERHSINFPERDVVLALATEAALGRLISHTDAVAELRLAKDTPAVFLEMGVVEEAAWVDDMASRLIGPPADAPAVCILDSGATRGHPLLAQALSASDQHAYDDSWNLQDSATWNGHGTLMAGAALYGDLTHILTSRGPYQLLHRLETVKILPPAGQTHPSLFGAVTEAAVAKVERAAAHRKRTFCLAVTSAAGQRRGRPSSWSAAIDKLAYGGGDNRRLFVLAAGNVRDDIDPAQYPDANDLAEIESPAQAWNALVASAYTDKVNITKVDYTGWLPVAPPGDLSPTSRTSTVWERQWPVRPDVVFEGGNHAHNGSAQSEAIDELQLLSTHYRPNRKLLSVFGDTSAATAAAAKLSTQIIAARPVLWPETVRGLIVHSAEWTAAMRSRFDSANSQAEKMALLRRYGWGVPDLDRALLSASDDATLMIEDALLPFRKVASAIKTQDMQMHRLPWPRDELLALGSRDVELRLTLSYFVEPNPGERGWSRRHRYASHGLRFALKRSLETQDQFRQRINKAAAAEEGVDPILGGSSAGGDDWLLGLLRDRGSVHSDIWRGSAAELADRDAVGIYPLSGWWKEKPALQRWDRSVRYSLIVSVRAIGAGLDLLAGIENRLAVEISTSA